MKRYKIIALLLSVFALITSCNNDGDIVPTNEISATTPKANSNMRSYSEALEIAQNAISILDKNAQQTRSSSGRSVDLNEKAIAICAGNRMTRSSESNSNDTLMYVFNYKDNNGFAVVAADKGTEGLIAVIESGHYDPSDTTDTGFRRYMTAAKYYILANQVKTKTVSDRAPKGFYFEFDTIGVVNIPPRITVKWGPRGHEGHFCPNFLAGCTNITAAIIMSYFEFPSYIFLTYDGNPPNVMRTLNWSGMKSYINRYENQSPSFSHHNPDTCTNVDHISISHLCRELGHKAESNYSFNPLQTDGSIAKTQHVLYEYGYTVSDVTSYQYLANTDTIKNNLSDGKLIFMSGLNSSGDGHSWAIDGYYGFVVHSQYYEYGFTNGMPDPAILMDEQYITHRYNHINWGVYGLNNGFFADGVFSFYGVAYSHDGGVGYVVFSSNDYEIEMHNFAYNLKFITVYKD